jgi:hypothetical protein
VGMNARVADRKASTFCCFFLRGTCGHGDLCQYSHALAGTVSRCGLGFCCQEPLHKRHLPVAEVLWIHFCESLCALLAGTWVCEFRAHQALAEVHVMPVPGTQELRIAICSLASGNVERLQVVFARAFGTVTCGPYALSVTHSTPQRLLWQRIDAPGIWAAWERIELSSLELSLLQGLQQGPQDVKDLETVAHWAAYEPVLGSLQTLLGARPDLFRLDPPLVQLAW